MVIKSLATSGGDDSAFHVVANPREEQPTQLLEAGKSGSSRSFDLRRMGKTPGLGQRALRYKLSGFPQGLQANHG
jgi:hypothetical protein